MEKTKQTYRAPLPPLPPGSTSRRRASKWGYAIAIAIAALSLIGGLAWGITSFIDMRHDIDHFARADIPGRVVVRLPAGVGRVVYFEGAGAPTLAMLDVSVTGPDGENVFVHGYSGNVEYDAPGSVVGRTVGTFDATRAGSYTVSADRALGADAVVAVGPSIVRVSGWKVAGGVLIAVIGLGIATVIAVVTAIRRSP
jgi:hypothetical protein